jgi:hypothetical protein
MPLGRGIRRLALFALGAAVAASCDRGPAADARGVATELYETLDRLRVDGAPTPSQLAELELLLSSELRDLLRDANALRETDQKQAPDEKPSFAEGDLFTSLFEGPSSFEAVSDTAGPNGLHVVRMQFTLSGGPSPLTWTDRVLLGTENGRLVVSDVLYDGNWPFANKGTLLQSLRAALHPETDQAQPDSTAVPPAGHV